MNPPTPNVASPAPDAAPIQGATQESAAFSPSLAFNAEDGNNMLGVLANKDATHLQRKIAEQIFMQSDMRVTPVETVDAPVNSGTH